MADRALVERARTGDKGAYEALARWAARHLFQVAHRILRDTDAAEDAVQQALVTIWRELPRLRDAERFDAWAYRIVTRLAVAEAKRQTIRRQLVHIEAFEPSSPDHTSRVVAQDTIERAFENLSPEARAVVVLRYYVDLPIKEIGYALGIPGGTVGSRLNRAMREMRSSIEGDDPPGPTATTGRDDPVLAAGRAP